MKVILLKDVKDIGSADAVADVSAGYARNFLLPNKYATVATESAMKMLDARKKVAEENREKDRTALRELAARLRGVEVNISVDAGESGKLFGSVTSSDIARKIHETIGMEVDKKKIILDEPIKAAGVFDVQVKFASDISAILKVNVSPTSK